MELSHKEAVIVTDYQNVIEWLRRQGVTAEVVPETPDKIRGKHVIGDLPPHLATECFTITAIAFDKPPIKRLSYLSADEMEAHGARLETFVVRRVATPVFSS
jgi:putative CRISPR-associated protein (TIGR02620 family)